MCLLSALLPFLARTPCREGCLGLISCLQLSDDLGSFGSLAPAHMAEQQEKVMHKWRKGREEGKFREIMM